MKSLRARLLLSMLVGIVIPPYTSADLQIPDQKALSIQVQEASVSQTDVSISAEPLNQRNPAEDKPFTRRQGRYIGIEQVNTLTPDEFTPPYWNGRGIASGDVDHDGYVDVLLATKSGIQLYYNEYGQRFRHEALEIPAMRHLDVFIVALVDLNNDSWLDIFLTSYGTGNYYLLSRAGEFSGGRLIETSASPAVLTKALTFGDVDRDGDLDAVLGNWYYGYLKHFPPKDSDNYLLRNDNMDFSETYIPGIAGETLSILLSDFNGDNNLDLMVGNDFEPPDHYYLGDGTGSFTQITTQDGVIPISTNTTMSFDTADFDNDLDLDIYVTQIAAGVTGPSVRVKIQEWDDYCNALENSAERETCQNSVRQRFLFGFGAKHQPSNIKNCDQIADEAERKACVSMMILLTATRERNQLLCNKIPIVHTRYTCNAYFQPNKKSSKKEQAAAIPVTMNENVLLRAEGDGVFTNQAKSLGIETTGWSWNSKLADFDNDEWQDIYVVNGTWIRGAGTPQKFFFHNQEGESFAESTDEFGLQNFMLQSAFTEVDIDNDGDLDILANSTSGPIWFYRNNQQDNNAVEFQFADEIGNYYGIGTKIIIRYGDDGKRHQIRELKAGGGFLSFNAPVVHFGLGEFDRISKIEVIWSTGERSEVSGALPANAKYTITRRRQ